MIADNLPPCPFCGAGQTTIHETRLQPSMSGAGALIAVEVRHWCVRRAGVVRAHMVFVGRDHATALAAWSERAGSD
jgi:hypothetical protein